ncbi:MAG: hydrogenase expression/formation protein HypE [Candidatus Rokuibacteriota bacterium]
MSEDLAALLASCPAPLAHAPDILMAHGSGGRLTAELVERVFLPAFRNPFLEKLDDQAVLPVGGARLAFTTDAFVVTPIVFPGGDIGRLAVNGTVNDLAMSGARPLYLGAAFILEEGLPVAELERVVASMRDACRTAGVALVTGDTKVVERDSGDKVFITTTGIGVVEHPVVISADRARPGDRVLLSGTIGDHGIAIMAARDDLGLEHEIASDSAPLHELVAAMLETGGEVHCLRDPTRGGLATTLNELARRSRVGVVIDEARIPVREDVRGACELLGLDPLYVANEGKLVAVVAPDGAERLLTAMRARPEGRDAAIVGEVVDDHPGLVVARTRVGGSRVVDLLTGDQLPRIC